MPLSRLNERASEAIRSNQKQSEALRGSQVQSSAIKRNQVHSACNQPRGAEQGRSVEIRGDRTSRR